MISNLKERLAKRRLRFDITTGFIVLFLISNITIIAFSYFGNTNAMVKVAHNVMQQLTEKATEKSMTYLGDARSIVSISNKMVTSPQQVSVENKQLYSYFINILDEYDYFDSVYAGATNGDYVLVEVNEPRKNYTFKHDVTRPLPGDIKYIVEYYKRSSSPHLHSYTYLNEDQDIVGYEEDDDLSFDHRKRPWYTAVEQKRAFDWSGIYAFAGLNVAGVSASTPLYGTGSGDTFFGVMGIDITLGNFARYLREIKVGEKGEAFVFNDDDHVIAHPDPTENMQVQGQDDLRPRQITNLKRKEVVEASRIFKETFHKQESRFIFKFNGEKYIASFTPLPDKFKDKWFLGIVVPINQFVGVIKDNYILTVIITFLILLVCFFLITRFARLVSQPIVRIAEHVSKLQSFELKDTLRLKSPILEIQSIQEALQALQNTLVSFGKFVPQKLVKKLMQKGGEIKLGGRTKELTMFFSDIEGFTSISENMTPDLLALHLSEYFDELSNIIIDANGTIDKYVGDAIVAFWGAPLTDRNHIFNACHAALKCQKRLSELNKKWKLEKKPQLRTRIGLHVDKVIVGNIGSEERINYTVLGDGVNLAARLEGVNKIYGTNILVSEPIVSQVAEKFLVRPLDLVAVKGKQEAVVVYELLAQMIDDAALLPSDSTLKLAERSAQAFKLYTEQRWEEAIETLQETLRIFPNDKPSQLLLERSKEYQKSPPAKDDLLVKRMKQK